MNEELKQAIGRLKKDLKECKNNTTALVFTEDLETALTYIDNSISKEVIEKEIEKLDLKISECKYTDNDIEEYKQDIKKEKRLLLRDKKVLQELLEGK